MSKFVNDAKALARLPKAGFSVQLTRWTFAWLLSQVKHDWHRRVNMRHFLAAMWRLMVKRNRLANAWSIYVGPVHIVTPARWLEGPARTLYPEAFNRKQC